MKKLLFVLLACVGLTAAADQYIKVTQGENSQYFLATKDAITFNDGQSVTILGETFNLGDITSIEVVDEVPTDDKVVGEIMGFSYVQGSLFGYGKGKKETVDVAILMDDPNLVGNKITGMRAYIATAEGIGSASLWASKELALDNKLNAPDLFSYDVTPQPAVVGDVELQMLQVEFDEPYEITTEPIYLGYTIVVEANSTDAQKNPIVLSKGSNPNGFFLHMNKSVLKWTDYVDKTGGVAFIVADVLGDYPEYSVSLSNPKLVYTEEGEEFMGEFSLGNLGTEPITSLKYSYYYGDGNTRAASEVLEGEVTLPTPIEPGFGVSYPVVLTFEPLEGYGAHALNVSITEVNGNANANAEAPAVEATVNVIPFTPVHRPLVEEYTGLWCGYCPRGYLAMEELSEHFGTSAIGACYHNGDPMAVTNDYPVNVTGFPSASIDRMSIIDPYYGSTYETDFGIYDNVEDVIAQLAFASIEVECTLEGSNVNVTSTAAFIADFAEANYEIGYLLLANGLTDPSWGQSNYYAGEKGYEGTPLQVLTEWNKTQYDLPFNDVVIDTSAMNGVKESLPSSIELAKEYTNNFTFYTDGNTLVQNPENLAVVVYIIDKNTGLIVNANKCAINSSSQAVEE